MTWSKNEPAAVLVEPENPSKCSYDMGRVSVAGVADPVRYAITCRASTGVGDPGYI